MPDFIQLFGVPTLLIELGATQAIGLRERGNWSVMRLGQRHHREHVRNNAEIESVNPARSDRCSDGCCQLLGLRRNLTLVSVIGVDVPKLTSASFRDVLLNRVTEICRIK